MTLNGPHHFSVVSVPPSSPSPPYFPSLRTSSTATSPTIWRLAPLTLSMVSSLVCHDGIVEVHHVDRADAGLLQLEVVVDQRVLRGATKVPA